MEIKIKGQPVRFAACHQIPSRSFFFRGKQLPLCARCTGLTAGFLTYPLFALGLVSLDFGQILILHLPMIIDGALQAISRYESKNWRRFVSGLLAGIALAGLVQWAAKWVAGAIIFVGGF